MGLRAKASLIIGLGCYASAGFGILMLVTPWGLGLSPDSAVYIGGARSLSEAEGFSLPVDSVSFAPIVHYPPLYPVLLAMPVFVGFDPFEAARWLNAVLFGANVFLTGFIAFTATGFLWPAIVASGFMITAFPMAQAHTMAWSEPLFIFFELCGSLFLLSYLWRGSHLSLLGAAVATALGAVSRYAGIAMMLSGIAGVMFLSDRPRKTRISDAAFFLFISSMPLALWMTRNWMSAGDTTNRNIGFHPIGWDRIHAIATTVLGWFSGSGPAGMIVFASLTVIGLGIWLQRRRSVSEASFAGTPGAFRGVMILIVVCYLLVLCGSISFLDNQTPIDSRILAPIYPPLMLLGVGFMADFAVGEPAGGRRRCVLWSVAVAALVLQTITTWPWLTLARSEGIGYAGRTWRESEVVEQVRKLEASISMYSNAPDVLYTLLGRPANMIPRKVNPDTSLQNQQYGSQLAGMRRSLQSTGGVVVYFDQVRWRWYLPEAKELEEALGLKLLYRKKDGAIYKAN